jgi:hypothetical protein
MTVERGQLADLSAVDARQMQLIILCVNQFLAIR